MQLWEGMSNIQSWELGISFTCMSGRVVTGRVIDVAVVNSACGRHGPDSQGFPCPFAVVRFVELEFPRLVQWWSHIVGVL